MEKSADPNAQNVTRITQGNEVPVSEAKTEQKKAYLYLHSVFSFILVILIIIAMFLPWFDYCLHSFLSGGANVKEDFTTAEGEYSDGFASYSDWKDKYCAESSDELFEPYCPGFCDNIPSISGGMTGMIILGVLAILANLMVCILSCCAIGKKGIKMFFPIFFLVLPFAFYLLAIIILAAVGGMNGFDSTESVEGFDIKDYTLGGGFIFAIVVVILEAAYGAFGVFFTRNAFKGKVEFK